MTPEADINQIVCELHISNGIITVRWARIFLHVGFVVCLNEAMDMILGTETMVTLLVVC